MDQMKPEDMEELLLKFDEEPLSEEEQAQLDDDQMVQEELDNAHDEEHDLENQDDEMVQDELAQYGMPDEEQ